MPVTHETAGGDDAGEGAVINLPGERHGRMIVASPAGRPRPKWPERPKDADPDEEDSFRTLELRDRALEWVGASPSTRAARLPRTSARR